MKLREFGPDIWIADGPPVYAFGPVKLPTRMIVVKLADGSLWINSPIVASGDAMQSVANIGPVHYLVAPTPLHVWRLQSWKAFFPNAVVCGPSSSCEGWRADIDQIVLRGNAFVEEIEFFHPKSKTLIFGDFIQYYPAREHAIFTNALARIAGVLDGGVPLDIRLSFTKRGIARKCVQEILSWDFDRLIVAHGRCLDRDAKPFVERAFSWLTQTPYMP